MIEVLAVAVAAVLLGGLASHAFHSWLAQRERERLSALDKVELVKRLDDVDGKVRELKNTLNNRGR